MKTDRPYCIDQPLLLSPDLREWLPEDHLAYFISDLVDQLDRSPILREYEDETRGYPPYHPVMMVKVLMVHFLCDDPSTGGDSRPNEPRRKEAGPAGWGDRLALF